MTRHVFGPLPSRRLGRSLGVDLVPLKTCSYDCIYCQLGPTTCRTIKRTDWVPLEGVIADLESRLSSKPDYITLSGSGEPTLHSQVDRLIAKIKAMTDIPVAVLTNGSLLWSKDVRRQLLEADLVMPSLDAGNARMFHMVNRPHERITFQQMLNGLVAFRQAFRGQYWLEIMVIGGHTDTPEEMANLAECVNRICPDHVQLNTVTRPPADKQTVGVSREQLTELSSLFHPPAEVIADFRGVHQKREFKGDRTEVLALLQRRPCSVEDIAQGLEMHRNEVLKHLDELRAQGQIESWSDGNKYYLKTIR